MWTLLPALAFAEAPAPFTCCDDPVVEKVVGAWVDAVDVLAAGRPPGAALEKLANAAATKGRAEDREALSVVAKEADRLATAPLATVQAELSVLARHVVWLSLRHESGAIEVVQASCPGLGSWIQRVSHDRVINPFGVACGTLR